MHLTTARCNAEATAPVQGACHGEMAKYRFRRGAGDVRRIVRSTCEDVKQLHSAATADKV